MYSEMARVCCESRTKYTDLNVFWAEYKNMSVSNVVGQEMATAL